MSASSAAGPALFQAEGIAPLLISFGAFVVFIQENPVRPAKMKVLSRRRSAGRRLAPRYRPRSPAIRGKPTDEGAPSLK
jgi:hypothetical protein